MEPPCGQLNLANPEIYHVLSEIYKELLDIFSPVDIFHFGGDEVSVARGRRDREVGSKVFSTCTHISTHIHWQWYLSNVLFVFPAG